MKNISLSVMGDYKDLGMKFAKSIPIEKEIKNLDEFVEVNISVEDNSKDDAIVSICNELSNMIINIVKDKTLKRMVEQSYKDTYRDGLDHIYKCSLKLFGEKEHFVKDILFNRIYEYFVHNDYININGFIKFRLQDMIEYILEIRDLGFEEYLLEKDYNEFISLLRYFVQVQDAKLDLLKIYIDKDGTFRMCDKNDNSIENSYTKDIINMALKENMNYEDFLISTLITLCPEQIIIYDNLENSVSKEIIETIEAIFEGKVSINYRA